MLAKKRKTKQYKYALVRWDDDLTESWGADDGPYSVEYKKVLREWWSRSHTVICDDQPHSVLKAMLKLMKGSK